MKKEFIGSLSALTLALTPVAFGQSSDAAFARQGASAVSDMGTRARAVQSEASPSAQKDLTKALALRQSIRHWLQAHSYGSEGGVAGETYKVVAMDTATLADDESFLNANLQTTPCAVPLAAFLKTAAAPSEVDDLKTKISQLDKLLDSLELAVAGRANQQRTDFESLRTWAQASKITVTSTTPPTLRWSKWYVYVPASQEIHECAVGESQQSCCDDSQPDCRVKSDSVPPLRINVDICNDGGDIEKEVASPLGTAQTTIAVY